MGGDTSSFLYWKDEGPWGPAAARGVAVPSAHILSQGPRQEPLTIAMAVIIRRASLNNKSHVQSFLSPGIMPLG